MKAIIKAYNPKKLEQSARKQMIVDALMDAGAIAYAYNLCGYQMTKVEETKPRELPTYTVQENIDYAVKLETLPKGYIQELLRDMLVAELSQKKLQAAKPEYTTVKVRAKELGFSVAQIGTGSQLGKWVKSHLEPAFVERVGKYEVKHYEVNGRLDDVIDSYFR
ncbi:MAG: hypothetical protein ACRDBG_22075 [Waterburya sp.]